MFSGLGDGCISTAGVYVTIGQSAPFVAALRGELDEHHIADASDEPSVDDLLDRQLEICSLLNF